MPLQVRPGYQNPLTMKKESPTPVLNRPTAQKTTQEQERKTLEQKRQSLQNEVILLSSSTNGGEISAEAQKILNQKIEEVSAQIKTLKPERTVRETTPRYDTYEAESVRGFNIYKDLLEDGEDPSKYTPFADESGPPTRPGPVFGHTYRRR